MAAGALILGPAPACWADDNAGVSITSPASHRLNNPKSNSGAIRLDVNLALIPVLVTDAYERPVRGLGKEDFRLFEDGTEQKISAFFNEDSPISIGLVFDASNSMRRKMDQSRQAIREFLRMSLPGDEFFLLKFSNRPEWVCGLTSDVQEIEESLITIQPGGWTSLFDAVHVGLEQLKNATKSRKVLLVLSDGGDNNSRYTERELKALVKEADVRIFAISILDRSPLLESISLESGGRAFRVRKLEELPALAANVSEELHSEYVLGFVPASGQNDGKYRRVRVDLVQPEGAPKLKTSWKRGYYSPGQ